MDHGSRRYGKFGSPCILPCRRGAVGGLFAFALLGGLASLFDFRTVVLSAMGLMAAAAMLVWATRRFDRQSDLYATGQA